jgi:hypothetical protein
MSREIGSQRGIDMQSKSTAAVIEQFNNAFQRHDPSLLVDLIADDCVLENTTPAPDGAHHMGRDACLALWQSISTTPNTHFDLEDVEVAGERAIIRWRFWWGEGIHNSVRGVNLLRVRDGLIVEGMGYVKGA